MELEADPKQQLAVVQKLEEFVLRKGTADG
jgi:hypothetical protein